MSDIVYLSNEQQGGRDLCKEYKTSSYYKKAKNTLEYIYVYLCFNSIRIDFFCCLLITVLLLNFDAVENMYNFHKWDVY